MQHEPDAADGVAGHREGERRFGRPVSRRADEVARVLLRVRMRERVAQIDPDVVVVRVPRQRVDVRAFPRSHVAGLQAQQHRYLIIWSSGYLVIWLFGHLVIWLFGYWNSS